MKTIENNQYRNLCNRHNVSTTEIKKGVDVLSIYIGHIVDPIVMIAITELLLYGDIKEIEVADNGINKPSDH